MNFLSEINCPKNFLHFTVFFQFFVYSESVFFPISLAQGNKWGSGKEDLKWKSSKNSKLSAKVDWYLF